MSESKQARIDRLLRDGLDHYGTGRVADAVHCWRSVLALEPAHPEARDYLQSAGADPEPPDPEPEAEPAGPGAEQEPQAVGSGAEPYAESREAAPGRERGGTRFDEPRPAVAGAGTEAEALVAEAKRAMREGSLETALDLFEQVARRDPDRLEAHSYAEMLRSRLLKLYRDQVGDGGALLRMRVPPQEVMKFNLPAAAGFVLSLVDDTTRVDDVISLSGLDAFETLRILAALVDVGIVEVER